ncbi:hypothetical protein LOTGIDRAFT_238486 [Lottia gigantea]|uniref:U5 small nuclear ribonucleoprotein TSSC4 n=1 Tax=Lottia gigantea TaxID=225164 RepID=V4AU10_LOTGI|nr:hypothetical protein LOTGIDRAFT_238486 [Lottia gigantea]ESP00793.1 hypothetical protein LOTGIDRAFT_238486 [Lottia gigantea]
MATPKIPVFELEAAGNDFKSKSKDIFGVLQTLEDKHSAVETARKKSLGDRDEETLWKNDPLEDVEIRKGNLERSSDFRKDDRKQDGFRKPYNRPPSHRKYKKPVIPEYRKHPEKYTCYSLGDVSSNDMSDASNSRAAFDFLDERKKLREQRERGSDEEEAKVDFTETACSKGAFTFKKQNKKVEWDIDSKTSKPTEKVGLDMNSKISKPTEKVGLDMNSKISKSTEKSFVKVSEVDQDLDISVSSDVTEEIKDNNSESTSFKRRKTKQRNIRVRENEDDDET